uniref:Cytochrome b5 heme-binding domain-containing protein n=1 Tax=Bionectria ochroleuca TaxID=29856 RepID=A0A8H7NBA8_BIOOC
MGWMNRGSRPANRENNLLTTVNYCNKDSDTSATVTFVEDSSDPRSYQKTSTNTKNEDLPYIDASVIIAASDVGLLWLVIDNIVYDCTEFVHDHPGGSRVLESFRSSNCSWQFWRFHGTKDMIKFGLPLRVGCTSGIQNKFQEPARFVGLRKLWGLNN